MMVKINLLFTILFLIIVHFGFAQEKTKEIKFIPELSGKIGSQHPVIGGQIDLVTGIVFDKKFFAGVGVGYTGDMGMGGTTVPLFLDGRFYFSLPKNILFVSKDDVNDFQLEIQAGIDINNNETFKTGTFIAFGIAYRFDFIKIKKFNFPPFYFGLNFEINKTKFYDEYRGYVISDGYIKQLILNFKVAFDIKGIKLKK